ncbi:hypothetical protein [Amycolatopsis sp. NPDC051903]|uniref:hypothetical protein n=1 Tax=Amycolatopsis sp. NPDC051903 TaxID=3363936 RepID=UPI0037BC4BD9
MAITDSNRLIVIGDGGFRVPDRESIEISNQVNRNHRTGRDLPAAVARLEASDEPSDDQEDACGGYR